MKQDKLFIIRIDDRLIHGQVIVGWVKLLNIEKILLVNEQAAKDSIKKELMRTAVPSEVDLEIGTINNGAKSLLDNSFKKQNTILIVESPRDAVKLFDLTDGKINSIIIGGIHYKKGKLQLKNDLFLGRDDIKAIKYLLERNVEINYQSLPNTEKTEISVFLDMIKKNSYNSSTKSRKHKGGI